MSSPIAENADVGLAGKAVLVTGGSQRIGRAIALAFARKGSLVLIHYHRSGREARRLEREIVSEGGRARLYQADLSKSAQVRSLVRRIEKHTGGVDILINNAAVFYPTPFEKVVEREWDEYLALHVKAPFFLAQAFAPGMKRRGWGRIINIVDAGLSRPYVTYLLYGVSKTALLHMTQALAKQLAPEVLVTAVCPGPILAAENASQRQKDAVVRRSPLGRWGSPAEVARLAVFLAESDYATGSCYHVDGGMSLV